MPPAQTHRQAELSSRFVSVRAALCSEAPDALDRLAALAVQALADGDLPLAAASAGTVVLAEHLQSAIYRHAPRMLGVLAAVGPDSAAVAADGLLAWAGAAVAHDYGVLPSWPRPDIATLMERAQQAATDTVLALACALGEVCERSGADAEFAALHAQVAAFEVQPGASAFWRGHWAIVCAWHLVSFAKPQEALQRLEFAQALAAQDRLHGLAATAALQRARLIEWRRDPAKALALAEQAVSSGDPARTPLWWADHADIQCRVALQSLDFHAAVGHARRAAGHLQTAGVWPGYQVTYRLNEAYALLGAGAVDEAMRCFDALNETSLPRYLAARLRCLADLTALAAADQRGDWNAMRQATLIATLRSLRELEWPSVLPLLPAHIARLFVRALDSGVELDWVRAAIRTRKLPAPLGAPEAWPWSVRVHTLGSFEVTTESGALATRDSRKAASKPLQLLRLLAAHGHGAMPVDAVAETLWPGDGREGRARRASVHRVGTVGPSRSV
jgi:tetratricopeptide (TPR) repeat protein